jgi:transcriptional regulator with XRE-family HTH domain
MNIVPKSEKIKILRIKSGFSMRGLATETKTHYSTISNIENAKGSVLPKTAKAICDALKQEFDDLFEIV